MNWFQICLCSLGILGISVGGGLLVGAIISDSISRNRYGLSTRKFKKKIIGYTVVIIASLTFAITMALINF